MSLFPCHHLRHFGCYNFAICRTDVVSVGMITPFNLPQVYKTSELQEE